MSGLVNKVKQFRNIGERNMEMTVKPAPPLEETEHSRDTTSDFAVAGPTDEVPALEVPIGAIDQPQMQVGLPAVPSTSFWSSPLADGISIHDQQTGLLPAVPKSGKAIVQSPAPATQTTGSASYIGLIRDLVKNSGIYAIASLTAPLVTLLLAPFLTHRLSRSDYGALAVLITVVALVAGVAELGLSAASGRLYVYDCKTQREQLDTLSTLVSLFFLILIPITTIGVMTAPWLSTLLLGSTSYTGALAMAAVLVLTQNLTYPGLMWLRAERRAVLFTILSIANLLITAAANVVLVGMLHMGVVGSLLANGLGDAIIIVCTLPIILWRAGFHLRFALAVSMLAFGLPHVTNLVSGWVLQLSDRYLLERFASLSLAGGYSVAYSLGGALSAAIVAPFSAAWWALIYHIMKREEAKHIFKLIFRGFSFVLLFATLSLSLFGRSVFDLLFPASYHADSSIIPIIALSTLFSGIFIVVNLGVSSRGAAVTWMTSLFFIVSALMNVGLNIILIPAYGMMGAALATLVAYIALAVMAYLFTQRIYPVPFEVSLFLVALGIGTVLYFADYEATQGRSIVMISGIHIGSLLLYGLCLLFLGWLLPRARGDPFPSIKRRTKEL